MIIIKDNHGRIIGWRETYNSKEEIVDLSANGNIIMIAATDTTTGKLDSQTLFGKPRLLSEWPGVDK